MERRGGYGKSDPRRETAMPSSKGNDVFFKRKHRLKVPEEKNVRNWEALTEKLGAHGDSMISGTLHHIVSQLSEDIKAFDDRARVIGDVKNALKSGEVDCRLPECRHCHRSLVKDDGEPRVDFDVMYCASRVKLGQIAVVIICNSAEKELVRMATTLLDLCFPNFEIHFWPIFCQKHGQWLATIKSEVEEMLSAVDRCQADDDMERLAHIGASLKGLLQCQASKIFLLERLPWVIDMSAHVIRPLSSLLSMDIAKGDSIDQSASVKFIEHPLNFLLMLLDHCMLDKSMVSELAIAALKKVLYEVLNPLLDNPDIRHSLHCKPVRFHCCVAVARINYIFCVYQSDANGMNLTDCLRSSILQFIDIDQTTGLISDCSLLGIFSETKVGVEVFVTLLHQVVALLPLDLMFAMITKDSDKTVAQVLWEIFWRISGNNILEEAIQTPCLKGMDEWMKNLNRAFSADRLLNSCWSFWRGYGRDVCVKLVRHVLNHWGHGSRKARYHFEPLLRSTTAVMDFCRLKLQLIAPNLENLQEEQDYLKAEHASLIRALVAQVTDYDSLNCRTNLKASLPILREVIERGDIGLVLDETPNFLDSVLKCCSSDNMQVRQTATRLFLLVAASLEVRHEGRRSWVLPLATVLSNCFISEEKREEVSQRAVDPSHIAAVLLPELAKKYPDFGPSSLFSVLPEDQGGFDMCGRLMVWNAFRHAGYSVTISSVDGNGQSCGEIIVPRDVVVSGLLNSDVSTSMVAFDFVTSPPRKGKLQYPSPMALDLVQLFFLVLTRWPHSSMRHRVASSTMQLFEWIGVCLSSRSLVKSDPVGFCACIEFLTKLQAYLIDNCYPLAPFDRSETALEVLYDLVSMFGPHSKYYEPIRRSVSMVDKDLNILSPLTTDDLALDRIYCLISMMNSSYDKSRELALRILEIVPGPFAGLEDVKSVSKWFKWIFVLFKSARVRDGDCGACMIRLFYRKYVKDLGFLFDVPQFSTLVSEKLVAVDLVKQRDRLRNDFQVLTDNGMMHLAILEAQKCENCVTAYNVGAVIVASDGRTILSKGFSRELPGNTHAEEVGLTKLGRSVASPPVIDDDISNGNGKGITIYTTMEPCSKRLSGKRSCTFHCISAGVSRVVIGTKEPKKFVNCTGTRELIDAGISTDLIQDSVLQERCMRLNDSHGIENISGFKVSVEEASLLKLNASGYGFSRKDLCLHFLSQLVLELGTRVSNLEMLRTDNPHWVSGNVAVGAGLDEPDHFCSSNLSILDDSGYNLFGLVRSIRYCIEDSKDVISMDWDVVIDALFVYIFKALDMAVRVIGGKNSDKSTCASWNDNSIEENMSNAFEVDSRGRLAVAGPIQGIEEEGDESEVRKAHGRRIVVSSWLLVRDGSELLNAMVSVCPLQEIQEKENSSKDKACGQRKWLLSYDQVKRIGDWFLQCLVTLKHIGAIGSAVSAFQGICSTLSGLRSSEIISTSENCLLRLPRVWLEDLFTRLERGMHGFVLRKSAGLAGCFLALARGEMRFNRATLLDTIVSRLLKLAKSDSYALSTRIHSMNILKAVVEDADLISDVPFKVIERIFLLAIDGFCSSFWQVRNSSMMIYGKIVKKLVGQHHNDIDGSSLQGVSCGIIFARYGTLHKRLVGDLKESVEKVNSKEKYTDARLFPWLLFISRLKPDLMQGSDTDFFAELECVGNEVYRDDGLNEIKALISLISASAKVNEGMVRLASARAVSSIIPTACIEEVLSDTLEIIISSEAMSSNWMHGLLLRTNELLTVVSRRRLLEKAKVDRYNLVERLKAFISRTDAQLNTAMQRAIRIGKSSGCYILTDCVWDIVKVWLSLIGYCSKESLCLTSSALFDLALLYMGDQAKAMAVACQFSPEAIRLLLKRNNLDTSERICVFESLLSRDLAEFPAADLRPLFEYLLEPFVSQSLMDIHPPEARVRLNLLSKLLTNKIKCPEVANLLSNLLCIFNASEGQEVKIAVLGFLAAIVSNFKSSDLARVAEALLSASLPQCTTPLRAAAVRALRLIMQHEDPPNEFPFWLALLNFLQDESNVIREDAVLLANKLLYQNSKHLCETVVFGDLCRKMNDKYGDLPEWRSFASDSLLSDFNSLMKEQIDEFKSEGNSEEKGGIDIFEYEPENVYYEPLFFAKLLSILPTSSNKSSLTEISSSLFREGAEKTQRLGGLTLSPNVYNAIMKEWFKDEKGVREFLLECFSEKMESSIAMHPHIRAILLGKKGFWNSLVASCNSGIFEG